MIHEKRSREEGINEMEMKESFDRGGGRGGGRRGIPVDEIRRLISPRERTSLLNYAW